MARKTVNRKDLRRESEAAESRNGQGDDNGAEPKRRRAKAKTTKKTTKRAKQKAAPRRMLMWAIYNGNMKEEARYSYAERAAADKKLQQLRDKSTKKLYFLQPIKVPLGEAAAQGLHDQADTDDEPPAKKKKRSGEEE